jgi:hypothetical protein
LPVRERVRKERLASPLKKKPVFQPTPRSVIYDLSDHIGEEWTRGAALSGRQHWVCGVPECDDRAYARGMCEIHWARWRRGTRGEALTRPRREVKYRRPSHDVVACLFCNRPCGPSGLWQHQRACYLSDDIQSLVRNGYVYRVTSQDGTSGWRQPGRGEGLQSALPLGMEVARWHVKPQRTYESPVGTAHIFSTGRTNANGGRVFCQILQSQFDAYDDGDDWATQQRTIIGEWHKASTRARQLLRDHLDEREDRWLRECGWLLVQGSTGRPYIVLMERQHNIVSIALPWEEEFAPDEVKAFEEALRGGRSEEAWRRSWKMTPMEELCVVVDEDVPIEDNFLAQVLWLENDEPGLRESANVTPILHSQAKWWLVQGGLLETVPDHMELRQTA